MDNIAKLKGEIEATLNEQKGYLAIYENVSGIVNPHEIANCEGWIEALEYVLGRIDALMEKED